MTRLLSLIRTPKRVSLARWEEHTLLDLVPLCQEVSRDDFFRHKNELYAANPRKVRVWDSLEIVGGLWHVQHSI